MAQKTTYVLSYTYGDRDDSCEVIVAVMNDAVKAANLCDKFNEITNVYENEFNALSYLQKQRLQKTFWNEVRAKMPEHLKECIQLYPCSELRSADCLYFSVEEIPIWE